MNVMTRHITPDRRVHAEREIDVQIAGGDPGRDDVLQAAAPASGSAAKNASIDTMHAAPIASAATMNTVSRAHLAPEQHAARRPQEREQRNQTQVEVHRGVALVSAS
jgi:hypothetical protein